MNTNILLYDMPRKLLQHCHLSSRSGKHVLQFKSEIVAWCKENKIRYKRIGDEWCYEGYDFYTPENAMAFKLRWIDDSPTWITIGVG